MADSGGEHDQDGLPPGFKEELLQQLQDGAVVISSEGEVVTDDSQATQLVQEIIEDTEVETQEVIAQEDVEDIKEIHMETDVENETQLVTPGGIQDLITFHAVDSQGNIITGEDAVMEEGSIADHVGIGMDQGEMRIIQDGGEVISSDTAEYLDTGEDIITGDIAGTHAQVLHQNEMDDSSTNDHFLNVQEAVFNPETGTLQPIPSIASESEVRSVPSTSAQSKQGVKRRSVKSHSSQKVAKLVFNSAGTETAQPGHRVILDASSLQTLIQNGNIALAGSSGKSIVLSSGASQSKAKPTKGPAKILPAPIPVGDQQQIGRSSPQKIILKQSGMLTPIAPAAISPAVEPRLMPVSSTTGTNQVQYVRVMPKQSITGNKVAIPATPKQKIAPKPTGQTIILPAGTSAADVASLSNLNTGLGNIVLLPNYVVKTEQGPIPIRPNPDTQMGSPAGSFLDTSGISNSLSLAHSITGTPTAGSSPPSTAYDSIKSLLEPNGMRPRKPCNCTKSQCLKLYCDCFANGEFCHLCNCTNCFNNLNHEEDRQKAIKLVLERNPGAFRPKIGKSSQTGEAHERRHNKGCNCRRSGCLKNYCECYEAKIFCSGICKCSGCKNCVENIPSGLPNGVGVEQHFAGAGTSHRQTLKDLAEAAEVRVQQQTQVKNKMRAQLQEMSPQNNLGIQVPPLVFRYPNGTISYEVVTASVELLLAKAEVAEKSKLPDAETERIVLEEFGECLSTLMDLGITVD